MGLSTLVLIVSAISLVCFAIVYICIFSFYYFNRKKCIENKLEDNEVIKILDKDVEKYDKKKNKKLSFIETYYKRKKRKKVGNIISNSIVGIFLVALIGFFVWATVMKSNDQITYFGDKTYLVVQTSSMASINDNNKYLKDGSIDSKDKMNTRISQYAFIGIDKFKSEDQIKVYDIVAFRMDDKIIVHRVYSISIGEKDGHKLFTFRGDANPASMSGEINVTSDRIVGVFDGYQNQVLGSIVIYIQSGTGLISVFAIAIVLMVYIFYYDRIDLRLTERYEALMKERFGNKASLCIVVTFTKQTYIPYSEEDIKR